MPEPSNAVAFAPPQEEPGGSRIHSAKGTRVREEGHCLRVVWGTLLRLEETKRILRGRRRAKKTLTWGLKRQLGNAIQ